MTSISTAARAYVARVLGLNAECARSLSVDRLRGGERHRLLKVSGPECEGYVVRINHSGDQYERNKARREAMALRHLEGGLAPRLYNYDECSALFHRPTMLIAFLPGVHMDLSASCDEMLKSLGRTVGRLHDLRADRSIADFGCNAGTPAEHLIERFKWDIGRKIRWDKLPGDLATRFWKGYRQVTEVALDAVVQEEWRTPVPFSLLHGDMGAENMIWSEGRVRLVDWEDVRLGDAAEEVAYILMENALSDRGRGAFYSGYADVRGSGADAVASRVATWEPVVLFGSAMWWLDRYARKLSGLRRGTPDSLVPRALSHYRAQALQRLRRFEARFGQPA